jgi:hypothetical protein
LRYLDNSILLDKNPTKANIDETITRQPGASPSKPSVRFTAFDDPVITKTVKKKERIIPIDPVKQIGSLQKGR